MKAASQVLRLAFLGDIYVGSDSKIEVSDNIKNYLNQFDCVIANLEGPICVPSPIVSERILLRNGPHAVDFLTSLNISVVTLANNHIFDHGIIGFSSTINALKDNGISYIGAGENSGQASKPLIINRNGIKIGLISCTEKTAQAQIAATDSPGCNDLWFPDLENKIRKLKNLVDLVIVCPHWGYCDYAYPPAFVVNKGEQLIDAGADLIVGHHSHVVQGVRNTCQGQMVFYSLGDFYFAPYLIKKIKKTPRESEQGVVLVVEISEDKRISHSLMKSYQNNKVVCLESPKEIEDIIKKRSVPLRDLDRYLSFWNNVVRKRLFNRFLYWLNPKKWGQIRFATLKSGLIMLKEIAKSNSLKCCKKVI